MRFLIPLVRSSSRVGSRPRLHRLEDRTVPAWQGLVDASNLLATQNYDFGGPGGNENYYDGDFADYDADGLIDRAILNRYGLLWNSGGGLFSPVSSQPNQGGTNAQKNLTGFRHNIENGAGDDAIQWADIDGDGDFDVLSGGNGEPFLVQRNGKARFNVASNLNLSAWQIVSTDLENDGDVDFAVSSNFPNDFSLLVNNGSGVFTEQSAARGLAMDGAPPDGTVAGDVDGDGDYDFVFTKGDQFSSPELGIVVAKNNGAGVFTRQFMPFARKFPNLPDIRAGGDANQGMSLGDIDDDGDLDLVMALGLFFTDHNELNQTIGAHPVVSHAIFVNDGTGQFVEQSATRWQVGTYSEPILRGGNGELVDVDYDNDLDYIALRRDSATDIKQLQVFLNSGAGVFTYAPQYGFVFPGGGVGFGNDMDVTDLNGDGSYDIWIGLAGERVRTMLNTYTDPTGVAADLPRNFQVVTSAPAGNTLSWTAPPFAATARSYRVYRSTSPGLARTERELLKVVGNPHEDEGFADPITRWTTTADLGDPDVTLNGATGEVRFIDRTARPGVTYYYSVVHVGTENTHSRPTAELSAQIAPPPGADATGPFLIIVKPTADEWSQYPEIVLQYADGESGINLASLAVSLNKPLGTGDPATGGRPANADISDLFFFKNDRVFIAPFEVEQWLPAGPVTLTVSIADTAGNVTMRQKTFTVSTLADTVPTAVGTVTGVNGLMVNLSGAASSDSDGRVLRWEWYFPDGTTTLGRETSWQAPANGNYEVELYVWDDRGGVAEAEIDVVIGGPTIGALTDTPDPVAVGGTVTLTAVNVVAPGGTIRDVGFYRETNGVPGLQIGADLLLAVDTVGPYSITAPTTGLAAGTHVYYARAVTTSGIASDVVTTTNTVTTTAPVRVAAVTINDGAAQRSRVTSLRIAFDQTVVITGTTAQAFQLKRLSDNAVVTLAATVNNSGPGTAVTLTFVAGAVEFGSLQDGRYTLIIDQARVSNANGHLDGTGDGVGGDNYVFGSNQGLFRFYGDMNGDRRVDISDFGFFSLAFLTPSNFNTALDFNNDGRIDIADFGQFSIRFFTSLP